MKYLLYYLKNDKYTYFIRGPLNACIDMTNKQRKKYYCQLSILGREEFNEKFFMTTNIVLFIKSNIFLKFSAPLTKFTQTSKYYFL